MLGNSEKVQGRFGGRFSRGSKVFLLQDSEGVGRASYWEVLREWELGRPCWEVLREWEGCLAERFRGSGREVFLEGSEGVGGRSYWEVLREWEEGLTGRF